MTAGSHRLAAVGFCGVTEPKGWKYLVRVKKTTYVSINLHYIHCSRKPGVI